MIISDLQTIIKQIVVFSIGLLSREFVDAEKVCLLNRFCTNFPLAYFLCCAIQHINCFRISEASAPNDSALGSF